MAIHFNPNHASFLGSVRSPAAEETPNQQETCAPAIPTQEKRIQNGEVVYRNCEPLFPNRRCVTGSNQGLLFDSEERRLVVVKRNPANLNELIQVPENPIVALSAMLQDPGPLFRAYFNAEDLQQTLSYIDCQEFINALVQSQSIFLIRPFAAKALCKIVQKLGLRMNLMVRYEQDYRKTLLLNDFLQNLGPDEEFVNTLLAIDPSISEDERILEEVNRENIPETARLFLKALQEHRAAQSQKGAVIKKMLSAKQEMSGEEIESLKVEIEHLSAADQKMIYQVANAHCCLPVILIMNQLGFGRGEAPLIRPDGPSPFAANMDALEMRQCVDAFFKGLLATGCLMTRSHFNKHFHERDYMDKGNNVGRILGRNYLAKKITELGIQSIKVPIKILVIEDDAFPLTVKVTTNLDEIDNKLIELLPNNATVYAERIIPPRLRRKMEQRGASELTMLVKATQLWDTHHENFVIGRNAKRELGTYCIDLETKNFRSAGYSYFGEMGESTYYGEFQKLRDTLRTLAPQHAAEQGILEIDQWADYCQKNHQRLHQERQERLQKETAALRETGCFQGGQFTFSREELFPAAPDDAKNDT